jgi:hypothetical protein
MARLVRAIRHPTGLDQMARTRRAMTVLGGHGSPAEAPGIIAVEPWNDGL